MSDRGPARSAAPIRGVALACLVAGLAAGAVGAQLVPLTELTTPYLGAGEPGLYPDGSNQPEGTRLLEALASAAEVVPRDAAGSPSADGWIGFVSVGMSNTNQEWSRFERESDRTAAHAARVVLVDLAKGGQDVFAMDEPDDPYWDTFDQRLAAAGVTAAQVQVVWLKQSVGGENLVGEFPARMQPLREALGAVIDLLAARCPNLRLALVSSRIWSSNPERRVFAYETAFAVKWMLGDRDGAGAGAGPTVVWGPYLWADGSTARADGLTWEPWDLEGDGVHPAPTAEWTVASALERGLGASVWTAPWYLPSGDGALLTVDAEADAHVDPSAPDTPFGEEPRLELDGGRRVYLRFDLSAVTAPLLRAKLSLVAAPDAGTPSLQVAPVADTSWQEATLTWNNAPPPAGPPFGQAPGESRGGAGSIDVTAAVAAALGAGTGSVGFLLVPPPAAAQPLALLAREAGEAPRLVLVLDAPGAPPPVFIDRFETADTWPWR